MARIMGAAEFKAKCLEVMDHVHETGEVVVLTKRGKPWARLAPVTEKPESLFGFWSNQVRTPGDIVAPTGEAWEAERD